MTKISNSEIVTLRMEGLNNREIAERLDCSPSTISRRLAKIGEELFDVQGFSSKHPDILARLQSEQAEIRFAALEEMRQRGMSSLSNGELIRAIKDLGISQAVDLDKYRLLTGKSTENVYTLFADARREANREIGLED